MWRRVKRLPIWGGAVGLSVLALLLVIPLIPPSLPKVIRIGTGPKGGPYAVFGQRLAARLENHGFKVELTRSEGSVQNISRLRGENPTLDAALVQGGVVQSDDTTGIVGVASVFYEPVWVFHPRGQEIKLLSSLRGKRIGVGLAGSGSTPLARTLLDINGIRDGDAAGTTFKLFGVDQGLDALRAKEIDAFIHVQAPTDAWLGALVDSNEFDSVEFTRAKAYAARFRYLDVIQVPRGFVSLERDVPARDFEVLATTANLAVRADIHPELIPLLIEICRDELSRGTMLASPGTFPSLDHVDFPLSEVAVRYYRRGPSWLYRNLPYRLAHALDRLMILLIPLLTLLYPLSKGAGPLYRWTIFRRIYPWYRVLRDLEVAATAAVTPEERAEVLKQLGEMDAAVSSVRVPTRYAGEIYAMRRDIAHVKTQVRGPVKT
jgi:TRAP-type uncharacterized transport system substrate-binding protein